MLVIVSGLSTNLTSGPYLSTLFPGIVIAQFLDYLFRSMPWVFGQPPGVVIVLAAVAISVLLWLMTQSRGRMTGLPFIVFVAMLVLWAAVLISFRVDGAAFTYAALTTPVILMMLIIKPPNAKEAWALADGTFALIATLSVLAQIFDWVGIRDSRTSILSRWSVPFTDLDLGYRWEGFFGDPNNAGLIGAVLLVYGLHRSGWLRGGLVITGALIVTFSESRTSLIALAAGVGITIFTSQPYRAFRLKPLLTAAIASVAATAAAAFVFFTDPTLNGRVQIWEAYFSLWQESPIGGVGSSGIDSAINNSEIPWDTIDGHSVLFDALTRHGVLIAILIAGILIGALLQTWRARGFDTGASLSMTGAWLFGALTYTLTPWLYINVLVTPLILALLLSQAQSKALQDAPND